MAAGWQGAVDQRLHVGQRAERLGQVLGQAVRDVDTEPVSWLVERSTTSKRSANELSRDELRWR
jgi:hypothetical protein